MIQFMNVAILTQVSPEVYGPPPLVAEKFSQAPGVFHFKVPPELCVCVCVCVCVWLCVWVCVCV